MNQSNFMKRLSQHAKMGMYVAGLSILSAYPLTVYAATGGIAQTTQISSSNEINVSGTVMDATGEPLIGASVVVKGTAQGAATDIDGNFTLKAPSNGELMVNYVGYRPEIIKIEGRTKIVIVLEEDSELLDEVVVVGYGTQKKESLTGAVSVVDSKMLNDKGTLSNPAQALQGQVPGVIITRSSSAPGAESWNMKLRGSFSKNNSAPLVIIDGVESEDFGNLNPNDIQTINFLKDASAAIYGSKAAGGVIIVQTKNAKEGKVKVEYSGSVTAKFVGLQPKLMNLDEWCDAMEMARLNDGKKLADDQWLQYITIARQNKGHYIDVANSGNPFPSSFQGLQDFVFFDTDWNDIMWGTAASTSHELSVSGGSASNTYRISGRYMYDGSNLKWGDNNSQRVNLRFNDKLKFSSHFSLESNISYFLNNTVAPTKISSALSAGMSQPGFPSSTINGKPYAWGNWETPNWQCELGGENKLKSWGINIGETFRYTFNDHWDAVVTAGYNHSSATRDIKNKQVTYYGYTGKVEPLAGGTPNDTYYIKTLGITNLYTLNGYVNWKQSFGRHNPAVMAGVQYSYKDYDYSPTKAQDILPSLDIINGSGNITLRNPDNKGPEKWQEGQMSYFARLNYNFDYRYLLEGNFRYDGSSKFRPENRWAFFWGVSGGWRINEEAFLKGVTWLNELKLRASYGTVGNQGGIDRYDGVQLFNFTQNGGAYIGDHRLSIVDTNGKLISLDRSWETIKNTNVAVDLAVLNNRLRVTAEMFWKRCDNMLIGINYPAILGDAAPTANLGKFKAHGYEGQLTWNDHIGNVNYYVGGTITYATNTLVDNGGDAAIRSGVVSNREGYPLNSVFGLRYAGKIQTQDQLEKYVDRYGNGNNGIAMPANLRLGDNMYEDVNHDGRLDEKDFVYLGTDDPKLSFSFNAGLSWKGFDVSVVFQGVGDRTIWRGGDNGAKGKNDNWRIPMMSWYNNSTNQSVGKVWSPETPDAHFPTYTHQSQINLYNYYCSSWSVESGAYLRLKNITVGYTFPSSLMAKTHCLSSARIYVTGTDLWESSKINDGWDPEATRTVSAFQRYPFTRNVTFGLNLSF